MQSNQAPTKDTQIAQTARRKENGRLAYYKRAATAEYWDYVWPTHSVDQLYTDAEKGNLGLYEEIFTNYLPKRGRILEAGCGLPNHVLEALASGLPVLYDDSGAMREVIGECGLPVTIENFLNQYVKISGQLRPYSQRARQRAELLFSPSKIFPKYMEFINMARNAPPKTTPLKRKWLAWTELKIG